MTRFQELGQRIAREQDALLERSNTRAQVRARLSVQIDESSELLDVTPSLVQRLRGSFWFWSAATSCALALLAIATTVAVVFWSGQSDPAALAVVIGPKAVPGSAGSWVEAPANRTLGMQFSDGTHVDVTPNSRARIAELKSNGAHLLLENGRARVRVQPRPGADWRISAGPFAVKVTGTRFDVRWSPEQDAFELDLTEGKVEISGCVFGENYALHAGQRAVASCRLGRLHVSAAGETADNRPVATQLQPSAADARTIAQASQESRELLASRAAETADSLSGHADSNAPAAQNGRVARSSSDATSRRRAALSRRDTRELARSNGANDGASNWRTWAEAYRYADALAAVRALGFASELRRADADELLLLSDLARYGRDYGGARDALRLLRQRFSGTRQAAQAAFGLGKLESDHDGSQAEAAGWFRTYLRELPAGPLAREAHGRLLEVTARTGDAATARELASQYLQDYPSGPHAALAASVRDAR